MSVSPAREAAYRILSRVESGRAFAVDLLQTLDASDLEEVDRRLVTELVMGVLRWAGELDDQIERLSGKSLKYFDPEVLTVLRLAVYQIGFLERIPKAAVVNEAVEMVKSRRKRSAAGLVNAVLRKCLPPSRRIRGDGFAELAPQARESVCRALPAWLLERWTSQFGGEAAKGLAFASVTTPPTTLRVAAPGAGLAEIEDRLAGEGIATRRGRYASGALEVRSGHLHGSGVLAEGYVVIQDEASQLVGALPAPAPDQSVLDLCAAPGIKTLQLAADLARGTLVSADISARRLGTMRKVVAGRLPREVRFDLVRLDAARELPFARKFDRILVDAPCSGTGTLARNPEIKWRLKLEDLKRLGKLQESILRHALAALAPGGRLVYATCSLEPEENEQVVERVLEGISQCRLITGDELSREFPHLARLFDPCGYFRTRPDLHGMDGFFAAVMVREG